MPAGGCTGCSSGRRRSSRSSWRSFRTEPGTSLIPDKIQHAVAFGVLGLLGSFAYPRLSPAWLVAGLSLFGALIELAQGTSLIHRDCDPLDWLTDTVACFVAVLAVHWWWKGRRSS